MLRLLLRRCREVAARSKGRWAGRGEAGSSRRNLRRWSSAVKAAGGSWCSGREAVEATGIGHMGCRSQSTLCIPIGALRSSLLGIAPQHPDSQSSPPKRRRAWVGSRRGLVVGLQICGFSPCSSSWWVGGWACPQCRFSLNRMPRRRPFLWVIGDGVDRRGWRGYGERKEGSGMLVHLFVVWGGVISCL